MPNKQIYKKQLMQLGAIMALTGCTSVADMVGYDTASLNEAAAKNYSQVVQQAQSQRVLDNTSHTSRRIKAVFERLKPYANQANQTGTPFNWQMNVFRGDELNAWAMPGGKMAMYTGMVERLKLTDDEIAAVIGHEMTHALLEHGKKAIGGQVLTGLGGSILAGASGVDANIVGLGTDLLASKPFSRHQESEADAGQTYNITNGEPQPFAELLARFFQAAGQNMRTRAVSRRGLWIAANVLEIAFRLLNIGKEPPLTRYTACLLTYGQTLNIEKARRELGYEPRIRIAQGIEHYVRHCPLD